MPVSKNQFHAFAVQFKDVGRADAEISVQDLLTCDDPQPGTRVINTADQIHLWNGSAWVKYYLSSAFTPNKWVKDGESDPTTDTVKNGDTFFFRRSSKKIANVTLNGEVNPVVPTEEGINLAKNGFYFVCYPWPIEFPVTSFKDATSDPQGGTRVINTADQVHRWTGNAWSKYYLDSNLGGYVKDGETAVTTDKLRVGEGVFFRRSSKKVGTLKFTKPSGL